MTYGLIGERLPHSFSKEIHEALAGYSYSLHELSPESLADFFKNRDFSGINVTIPYKEAVIPFLDEISPEAKAIGAVNTVKNENGRLIGYNTDFYGMQALVSRCGISPLGKKVAILGSGGTAKTAKALFTSLGAEKIFTVSREEKDGCITFKELYRRGDEISILVNTTPVGMFPKSELSPVELSRFSSLLGVIDAVYNPLRTKLVLDAKERGIPATGGLYMLVKQAAYAAEIFTGEKMPEDKVSTVYNTLLRKKENIVLTGMPGAGKSTVGRILAERLSMDFFDTDEAIVSMTGISISEIFSRYGEARFRQIESDVIRELSRGQGRIIATGGGAILSIKNIDNLRQNGKLYFLDRPLCELIPTPDRPTALTEKDLEERYNERYGLYSSTASFRVFGIDSADAAATIIEKDYLKQ